MSTDRAFSQWIKEQRRLLDLTQAELAARIGCSGSALQKFEEGSRRPSKQMTELLALHLAIPAAEHAEFWRAARLPAALPAAATTKAQQPDPLQTTPMTNLPASLTPLIGRVDDKQTIVTLLAQPDVRLVTITGTAGVGKTRLSLAVAGELLAAAVDFADGICFVPLAAISEPALLLSSIAQRLELSQSSSLSVLQQLVQRLHDKHLLLVLDNFEQIAEAAPAVSELLGHCPTLKVLVTSRSPLLLRGEYQYPLAPFALPSLTEVNQLSTAWQAIADLAAVQLFVATVQRFDPRFQVTPANAVALLTICRRLDGVALAIELAAVRLRQFNLDALLSHLQQPTLGALALLTDGARDLPPRQRTLYAAIAWSYDLLDQAGQRLFAGCGVFVGGFTAEALRSIALAAPADPTPLALLRALQTLLDHSLLLKQEQAGQMRYTMLETIRDFALAQLQTSGAEESVRQRHAHYFYQIADHAATDANQAVKGTLYQQMEPDHPNLRAALQWLIDHQPDEGLHMANALEGFWWARGYNEEGQRWLHSAIQANPEPSLAQAKAWLGLAYLDHRQVNSGARESYADKALQICRQLGDETLLAACYQKLGLNKYLKQQLTEAEKFFRLGWEIAHKCGQTTVMAELQLLVALVQANRGILDDRVGAELESALTALQNVGNAAETARAAAGLSWFYIRRGEYIRAAPLAEQALLLARESQDKHAMGMAESYAGDVALMQNELALASSHYQNSAQYFNEIGDSLGVNNIIYRLGRLAEIERRYPEANKLYQQCLHYCLIHNNQRYQLRCLFGLAGVALAQNAIDASRQFLTEAQELLAVDLRLLIPLDQAIYQRLLDTLTPIAAELS